MSFPVAKNIGAAPPYEELHSEPPQNTTTGYSSVPQNDTLPDEELPAHQHSYISRRGCRSSPFPPAASFEPHVHCESCDGLFKRQEKLRCERFCCAMVALTLIVAMLCGLMLGLAMANAKADKWHH
ncbi:hypothetical protein BJX76DRAFT_331415 [Aspergillus varians]